jgi:hypothetical protein
MQERVAKKLQPLLNFYGIKFSVTNSAEKLEMLA